MPGNEDKRIGRIGALFAFALFAPVCPGNRRSAGPIFETGAQSATEIALKQSLLIPIGHQDFFEEPPARGDDHTLCHSNPQTSCGWAGGPLSTSRILLRDTLEMKGLRRKGSRI